MTDVQIIEVAVNIIQNDRATQMRDEGLIDATVAEYEEAMRAGTVFPPIDLYHDGDIHWIGDGFHRLAATKNIGKQTIAANVRQGTRRDAILAAVGANADHGLRRTRADKRRSIESLLRDPEWSGWSDREIARRAKVDHKTVAAVRAELTGEIPTEVSYRNRHGDIGTMKVKRSPAPTGDVVARVLANFPDEVLIAECQRRGIEVVGGADV